MLKLLKRRHWRPKSSRTTSRSYPMNPVTCAAVSKQYEENVEEKGEQKNWNKCRSQQVKWECTGMYRLQLHSFFLFHLSFLKTNTIQYNKHVERHSGTSKKKLRVTTENWKICSRFIRVIVHASMHFCVWLLSKKSSQNRLLEGTNIAMTPIRVLKKKVQKLLIGIYPLPVFIQARRICFLG